MNPSKSPSSTPGVLDAHPQYVPAKADTAMLAPGFNLCDSPRALNPRVTARTCPTIRARSPHSASPQPPTGGHRVSPSVCGGSHHTPHGLKPGANIAATAFAGAPVRR